MVNLNDVLLATFGLAGIISYAIGILGITNLFAFLVYMGLVFKVTYWMQIDGELDVPGNSIFMTNPFFSLMLILIYPHIYVPIFAIAIFVYTNYLSPIFSM